MNSRSKSVDGEARPSFANRSYNEPRFAIKEITPDFKITYIIMAYYKRPAIKQPSRPKWQITAVSRRRLGKISDFNLSRINRCYDDLRKNTLVAFCRWMFLLGWVWRMKNISRGGAERRRNAIEFLICVSPRVRVRSVFICSQM